jgi:hypothetical protein
MATHGEIRWPSLGSLDGRLRGGSHGRRQIAPTAPPITRASTTEIPTATAITVATIHAANAAISRGIDPGLI